VETQSGDAHGGGLSSDSNLEWRDCDKSFVRIFNLLISKFVR